jgi:hypothetical protein
MFLSILWVALLSLISLCRADGGAFETCDELYLSGQNLVGSCGTGGGDPPYEWNNIWLGWCVSNQSGNLQVCSLYFSRRLVVVTQILTY